MTVSENLRDAISSQMTYAINPESGITPTQAFENIISLISCSTLTADLPPSTRHPGRQERPLVELARVE